MFAIITPGSPDRPTGAAAQPVHPDPDAYAAWNVLEQDIAAWTDHIKRDNVNRAVDLAVSLAAHFGLQPEHPSNRRQYVWDDRLWAIITQISLRADPALVAEVLQADEDGRSPRAALL